MPAAPATTSPGAPKAPATAVGAAEPKSGAGAESDSTEGSFEVTVTGRDDGRPRSGIPATVTGPTSTSLVSDRRGILALRGAPGTYVIEIGPTCGPEIQVQTSARGTASVAPGQVARGTLGVVWRHRFAPQGPVEYQGADDASAAKETGRRWPLGVTYLVRFTVVDRCSDRPAPGAAYPTYRFASTPGVDVEAPAAPADPAGRGTVRMTCRQPVDEVTLIVSDAESDADRYDLFDRAHLGDSAPECV